MLSLKIEDAVKKFVEVMNKYLGEPKVEIWDDFVLNTPKKSKKLPNEFLG